MIQVLSTAHYIKMPWKNGQGFTLEIARSHGDGLDDFDWRISIADVKTAGVFSHFLNKQRIIGVLEGDELVLHLEQQVPVTLKNKQFFAFQGEENVYAEVPQGPIRDFNLIYDPQRYTARLQWINAISTESWLSDADQVIIFNSYSELSIWVDGTEYHLAEQETLLVKKNQKIQKFTLGKLSHYDLCVVELFLK